MKKTFFPIFFFCFIALFSQQKNDSLKEKNIDEVVLVSSSRTEQKIENSPQKVEILGKEEFIEIAQENIGKILNAMYQTQGIEVNCVFL